MLPLRYSHRWQVGGVLLLAIVLAGTVMPVLDLWPQSSYRQLFEYDKWLHGIIFLVLTAWYVGQYAKTAYWRIAVGLVVFGGAIELVQRSLTYRSGDLADMAANVAGITVGFLLAFAGIGGWSARVEKWLESRQAGTR